MRREKIYIAGRVTGLPYDEVREKFARAETMLLNKGYNPVNPLRHVNCKASAADAMKVCIPLLCECTAIFLLSDWIYSEGAKIEAYTARYTQKRVINEEDLN